MHRDNHIIIKPLFFPTAIDSWHPGMLKSCYYCHGAAIPNQIWLIFAKIFHDFMP
jgi:hypothetical protein